MYSSLAAGCILQLFMAIMDYLRQVSYEVKSAQYLLSLLLLLLFLTLWWLTAERIGPGTQLRLWTWTIEQCCNSKTLRFSGVEWMLFATRDGNEALEIEDEKGVFPSRE